MILVHNGDANVNDPSFKAAVGDVTKRVSKVEDVQNVQDPYAAGGDAISKDRHSVLVKLDIKGDAEKAVDKIDPIVAQVEAAQRENRELPHRVVRHQRRQGAGGRLHERPQEGRERCRCRSRS